MTKFHVEHEYLQAIAHDYSNDATLMKRIQSMQVVERDGSIRMYHHRTFDIFF
jgi:hypothetical protein